ncbi:MAG: ATP-binding protein [Saprospiraceae bacterium]|nr:ATP-binding protein [Saprospiraceae bacterium]
MSKFLLIFLCFCSNAVFAQNVFTVKDQSITYIGNYIGLHDPKIHVNDIEQVKNNTFVYSNSNRDILHLGPSDSYLWLKFSIQNNLSNSDLVLSIDQPAINFVKLFKMDVNGTFSSVELGEHLQFSNRKYDHPVYIFDLNLELGATATYYLQIKSDENNTLPIAVSSKRALNNYLSDKDVFIGSFLGVMVVMFLYNFMIFLFVKDRSYLFYIIYLGFLSLTQLSVQGYTFKYLWPNNLFLVTTGVILFACIATIAGILFAISFLKIKKSIHPKIYYFLYAHISLFVLTFFLGLSSNFYWAYTFLNLFTSSVSLGLLFISYYFLYKGYEPARFFSLAWTCLLVFVILFTLRDTGIIEHSFISFYGVIIGSMIEVIFLSIALADRINHYRNETVVAIKEKEYILAEQNSKLELLVEDRTKTINENYKKIKEQDSEKEVLLKEIHHRVKNNLQIITSLLSLQNQNLNNPELKNIFTSSQYRINSMAIIHEMLYKSNSLSSLKYEEYLVKLMESLLNTFDVDKKNIEFKISAPDIIMNLETAIPLGLIINEIVTNALKYAFKKNQKGCITIEMSELNQDDFLLKIGDNGIGISDDFNPLNSDSLGTKLIRKLTIQLEGALEMNNELEGTNYNITFKKARTTL